MRYLNAMVVGLGTAVLAVVLWAMVELSVAIAYVLWLGVVEGHGLQSFSFSSGPK